MDDRCVASGHGIHPGAMMNRGRSGSEARTVQAGMAGAAQHHEIVMIEQQRSISRRIRINLVVHHEARCASPSGTTLFADLMCVQPTAGEFRPSLGLAPLNDRILPSGTLGIRATARDSSACHRAVLGSSPCPGRHVVRHRERFGACGARQLHATHFVCREAFVHQLVRSVSAALPCAETGARTELVSRTYKAAGRFEKLGPAMGARLDVPDMLIHDSPPGLSIQKRQRGVKQ